MLTSAFKGIYLHVWHAQYEALGCGSQVTEFGEQVDKIRHW